VQSPARLFKSEAADTIGFNVNGRVIQLPASLLCLTLQKIKIMRRLLLIAFVLVSSGLMAQETFKGEHFIEVTGTAETEVAPNEITFLIRLREFEENKNKVQLEKLDKDFLNALQAAGIDKKKLTLADAGSKLSRLTRRDKDAFREKTYQLVLSSAAEVEKFLEKLEPVQVSDLMLTRVYHTDYEKIKLDVKVRALQAAKAKADALLKGIGSEAGKPLMVREWENDPVQPYDMAANVRMKSMEMNQSMDVAQGSDTEFKKIRWRAQVSAQFEIK
jgi:uncharacterized protein